jgi:LPS-assembly protein
MPGVACARPPGSRLLRRGIAGFLAVLALLAYGGLLAPAPAFGQLTFPALPPVKKPKVAIAKDKTGQKQMLVRANEIDYDYTNHRIAAVGNVQIYYGGSTLEADRVIYDETTKRLHAEGNVRLTEEDGKVTHGEIMDLSDNYRDGFVDSLRLETPERTRMAATRADRTAGNFTVLHNGVYTACEPCKDDPRRPPEWQVKAVRIIHDQKEKMMYFEDARLEFLGVPLAWIPYFSAPDPTVKRKTGLLMPSLTSTTLYGTAIEIPYYWALAPNYDATFAPMITSRQGPLLQGEFRQRLLNGAYSIRAAGIKQLDKEYFGGPGAPGYRDFRGSVESSGQFIINTRWVWGWDAVVLTDKTFLQDYKPRLSAYSSMDPFVNTVSEGVTQLYLVGKGDRSYFDARSIYYLGFSPSDVQAQIPIIHPVIDYNYTFDHPILGGELSYNLNFTSLTRQQADFQAITQLAAAGNINTLCMQNADPALARTNCVLRGIPGMYNRFSAEAQWRRTITDSYGQMFTPFISVRADAAAIQVDAETGVGNFINTGDNNLIRAMPTVGLEYRYPFISVQSWGTQTVEPIVQIIARPNEPQVGSWPNEDAQSLVFEDSNLFSINKFAGWDRVEGGGRANYGVKYTAQFNKGGFVKALFGQSYSLFGQNSFALAGTTNTGLDSGLDTTRSDYVAGVYYQPNSTYTFSSRFRLDQDTFEVKRTELEASARFDRWYVSLLYGDYAAQPDIGFLDRRKGLLGVGSVKLTANWVLSGSAQFDLTEGQISATSLGLGYIDDCLILGLNYITSYSYGSGSPVLNHTVMLQLGLRTLGSTQLSQGITGVGTQNGL